VFFVIKICEISPMKVRLGPFMQRSTWTLICQGSTRIRRRILRSQIFFSPSIFWRTHSNLCAVNSSNTWVLIVFIFVEFLSSYLLSARRIQNV
jgi:hypothetical protein